MAERTTLLSAILDALDCRDGNVENGTNGGRWCEECERSVREQIQLALHEPPKPEAAQAFAAATQIARATPSGTFPMAAEELPPKETK